MAPLRGTLGRGRPADRDPLGATRWAAAPSQALPEGGRGTPQSPARKWGQRMLPTPRRPGPGATAPAPSTQPWTRALTSEPAGGRGGRLSHTDPGSEDRGLPTWATRVPCTQPPGRPLLPGGGRLLHCHLHTPLGRRERWNHLPNMQKRREESVSQENAAGRGPASCPGPTGLRDYADVSLAGPAVEQRSLPVNRNCEFPKGKGRRG